MRSFRRSALSLTIHIAVGGLASFGAFVSNNVLANEYNATGITYSGELTLAVINGLKPSDYDTIYWTGPGIFEVGSDLDGVTPPLHSTSRCGFTLSKRPCAGNEHERDLHLPWRSLRTMRQFM